MSHLTAGRPIGLRLALGFLLAVLAAPPAAAVEPETVRALLDRHAPAVVTIEAVVRTEFQMGGQGEDQESNLDLVGTLVDPQGLILVWNSRISSSRISAMMELMAGSTGAPSDFGIDMTPLSFQVRLPGSDEQVEAFLAASDPQLDLAFLQIAVPPSEPLPYVDLAQAATPAVGDELFAVNRLSASFAHAPFVETGRLVGELAKPRPALIFEGDFQGMGLLVFDSAARPVGVISTVLSSVATERAAANMAGMGQMLDSGDGKTMGPLGVFVLPAPLVARAVERSLERARAMQEERAATGGAVAPAGDEPGDEAAEPEGTEGADPEDNGPEDDGTEDDGTEDDGARQGGAMEDGPGEAGEREGGVEEEGGNG